MGRLGSHPHIVTIRDIGEEDRQPYIIQEFMEGDAVHDTVEQAPATGSPSTSASR